MADEMVLFEAAVHPQAQKNDYVGTYFTENDVEKMKMDLTKEIPVLWNHDWNRKLGRVKAGAVDGGKRLCMVGEIDRNSVSAIDIIANMRDGKLGTSLGMEIEKRGPIEGSQNLWLPYIKKKTISEVSLTLESDLPQTQIKAENVQADSKERLKRLQQRQKEWDKTKNNNYIGTPKRHFVTFASNTNNEIPMQTEIQVPGTGGGGSEKLANSLPPSQIKSDEAGQKIEGLKDNIARSEAVPGTTYVSNGNEVAASPGGDEETQKLAQFKEYITHPKNLDAMLQVFTDQQKQSNERVHALQKASEEKSEEMKKMETVFLDYLDLIHQGMGTKAHGDVVDQIKYGYQAPEQAVVWNTIASAFTHAEGLKNIHSQREKEFQEEREKMKLAMEKQRFEQQAGEEAEQIKRKKEITEQKYSQMAANTIPVNNKRGFDDFSFKTENLRKMARIDQNQNNDTTQTSRIERGNLSPSISMPPNILPMLNKNPSGPGSQFTDTERKRYDLLFPTDEPLAFGHENVGSYLANKNIHRNPPH